MILQYESCGECWFYFEPDLFLTGNGIRDKRTLIMS